MHDTSTRSPTRRALTPAPTASIVPTASWPSTRPGVPAGTSPLRIGAADGERVDAHDPIGVLEDREGRASPPTTCVRVRGTRRRTCRLLSIAAVRRPFELLA